MALLLLLIQVKKQKNNVANILNKYNIFSQLIVKNFFKFNLIVIIK
jgi:predicted YcjX-like family ATPase